MLSLLSVLSLLALSTPTVLSNLIKSVNFGERVLEERAGCNYDNCLRALIDPRYSSSATVFCSAYISVSAYTVTASATSTVRGKTSTVSANAGQVTITPTVASTSYISTTTSTVYTKYRAPDEGPDPNPPYPPQKRDVPIPSYVSAFPTSRISSACSCVNIPISTRTVTPVTTAGISTVTITPDAVTATGSPTTAVISATKTAYRILPLLCKPVNFKDYRNFVDERRFNYNVVQGTTKQECCLTCYNVQNCMSFTFNPSGKSCGYYVGIEQTDFTYKVDVCPLGVTGGSHEEVPGYNGAPQNYGPCLDAAPIDRIY